MPLYELLRPVARLRYAYLLTQGADVPHPRTPPVVETAGAGRQRVLLLGNGPSHGWGVVSHDLALTGHLAREIGGRTGRGTRVEYIGEEAMSAAAAPSWLRRADLAAFDAAVVVLGMSDAVRLTPVASWEASLRSVLGQLRDELPASAPIHLAEIHRVGSVPVYARLDRAAQTHAHRLNASMRAVAADYAATTFVLGDPVAGDGRALGSPAIYSGWARVVADAVIPTLPIGRTEDEPSIAAVPRYTRWPGFDRARELAASGVETELGRITDAARKAFGVTVAGVSLIEDDEVRYLGRGTPISLPTELSHCQYVVEAEAPLVVQRSQSDPRFRGNPVIGLTMGEFYAGHPIYSSTGEPIGSFCLMGPLPRRMGPAAMDRLQSFAAQAQAELWKLEHADRTDRPEQTRESEPDPDTSRA